MTEYKSRYRDLKSAMADKDKQLDLAKRTIERLSGQCNAMEVRCIYFHRSSWRQHNLSAMQLAANRCRTFSIDQSCFLSHACVPAALAHGLHFSLTSLLLMTQAYICSSISSTTQGSVNVFQSQQGISADNSHSASQAAPIQLHKQLSF